MFLVRNVENMNNLVTGEVLIFATRSQVYAKYSCLHVSQEREVMGRVVVFQHTTELSTLPGVMPVLIPLMPGM